jgi:2-polyprenyl-3-methyl-5-hydroxy-6-metoxy-1,4-benzoquinol methylase/uncharacterized protein YbaR (Trm112 family)
MDLLKILACPRDRLPVIADGARLRCAQNHSYPVVDGIPVLLVPELAHAAPGERVHPAIEMSLRQAENPGPDPFQGEGVHPQVQAMVAGTNGFMYTGLTLTSYPIPTLRWEPGDGRTMLDVGCNWGRWTVAAAKLGYDAVGLDPHLTSLRAARQVARACGVDAQFVCGDARAMPFLPGVFDRAFSYSVVQHFSKTEARAILAEISRVIRPGGETLVQMPNRKGIRSRYHLARRRYVEGTAFDVRYYTPHELVKVFRSTIGPSKLSIDGFFGLGIQPSDIAIMPPHRKLVIRASELMRKAAHHQRWLAQYADSLYVTSKKPMTVGQP